ncbi:hypothetical protein EDD37DRAFT_162449 [Exophiala viscosa]|uniref:Uncharacterized protein n=1 Tax=Exophiala viscosa TaxID=2486360 RepID=A0AAN6DMK6_9EURO|nr:hypothetical protein EDD36DRAFT_68855 [Exophiala viscosa]KAI1620621.1 hypothetical protein EDD37DRAFT_162449 [Exophiala viscosa]
MADVCGVPIHPALLSFRLGGAGWLECHWMRKSPVDPILFFPWPGPQLLVVVVVVCILLLTCHRLNLFITVQALCLTLEKSKTRGVEFVASCRGAMVNDRVVARELVGVAWFGVGASSTAIACAVASFSARNGC